MCHGRLLTAQLAQQVLTHWACAKISASGEVADEGLLAVLEDRLKGQPSIRSRPGAGCAWCTSCTPDLRHV